MAARLDRGSSLGLRSHPRSRDRSARGPDLGAGRRPPRRSLAPGSTRRDPLAGTLRRRRDSPRPGESALAGGCRVTAESDGARPPLLPRMRERIAPIPALLSTPSSPRAPSCPLFLVRTRNPDSFSQTTFLSTFFSARRRLSKEWQLHILQIALRNQITYGDALRLRRLSRGFRMIAVYTLPHDAETREVGCN